MGYTLSKDENAKKYDSLTDALKGAVAEWEYRHGIHEVHGPDIPVYDWVGREIGRVGYIGNAIDGVFTDKDGNPYVGYVYRDKSGSYKMSNAGKIGDALDETDVSRLRVRKLTPRECMRLMGYNDEEINRLMDAKTVKTAKNGKVTEKPIYSNSAIYRFAGNSVVVDCFAAILGVIVDDMDGKTPQKSMDEWMA